MLFARRAPPRICDHSSPTGSIGAAQRSRRNDIGGRQLLRRAFISLAYVIARQADADRAMRIL